MKNQVDLQIGDGYEEQLQGIISMRDDILTVQEVADYLKVSRSTVWRWCNQGKIEAFKVGRSWRIHRQVVEQVVGYTLDLDATDISSGKSA